MMRLDTTLVAARILGPVFVAAGIVMITRPSRVLTSMGGFLLNDALMTLAGFVVLLLGLAVVTFHRRADTVTAIFVLLIGWLFVARGAIMLIAPDLIQISAEYVARQPNLIPIVGCVVALLGVWLTYTGFISGMLRFDPHARH
jgi:hypothetical protein